jgi:tetratricopeptide (TPR) repeat protein
MKPPTSTRAKRNLGKKRAKRNPPKSRRKKNPPRSTEESEEEESTEESEEEESTEESEEEEATEESEEEESEEEEEQQAAAPAAVVVDETPVDEDISDELQAAMDKATAAEADGPGKAVEAWRSVIQSNPKMRTPRREYARVLRAAADWPRLIEALKDEEAKAAKTDGERVSILRETIQVYREVGNDLMVMNTYNAILKINPNDVETLDQLAEQYQSMKRWPDLVGTLQKKAALLEDHDEQVALYLRIANLYIDRFSNQAEAIKSFEKVLALDPDNADAASHLLAVYEKRRDWEKLIALREREIDKADESERAAKIYEVAKLAATRVKKPDICTHWWERVFEVEPENAEAITELEKLYERGKNWDGLAKVCSIKADVADTEKGQIDALQKLGLLYTDKVSDPEKAIDAWKRLLAIDPNHRRGQDSIKKLYIAQGAWEELEAFYRDSGKLDEFVRVLERQLDSAAEETKLSLAMKIAVTYRDEVGKADKAMRFFERVLTIDETNLEAAEALIPLYQQGRDPRKLVTALEIQLGQTEDPTTRQERIKVIAEYCEQKLRDSGAAFGWWLKAHKEDHASEWIREEAERLAQETGAWAEIVEAYEESLGSFSEPIDALPLMLVIAKVLEEELGDIDKALEMNTKILELDDSSEPTILALERLYIGRERYDDLLDIYRRKLEMTHDPDARTEIQYKLGQLYEDEVKDDEKAAEIFQAVLDSDGEDLRALQSLDRIFTRNENWSELVDTIGRQLMIVSPGEEVEEFCALKLRLARLRENQLDSKQDAIGAYQEILDLDPKHTDARVGLEVYFDNADFKLEAATILEPIYEEIEDWGKLIAAHEIQFEASEDQLRRVELVMRIGELYSKKLGDAANAFEAYSRAFREDPSTEQAKRELEELSTLLDEGSVQLVALFEGAIDTGDLDPMLGHELCIKVARAYDEQLDDSEKAVRFYSQALSIEPDDNEAIEALDRIFTRGENYPELLEVYRKKVEISNDADQRLGLLLRIASIHEEMLQNADEAISTYNEILGHDGENLQALRALDRLYVQCEQWHELGDNLSRQLMLCEDDYERVSLLVRLAALRESKLEELAAAIETYKQVLDLDASNEAAVVALEGQIGEEDHELNIAQILEPIYKSRADWSKQIGVYKIMAKHAYDPERKIELLHGIAELHEIGGDDGESAFDTYAAALREEPRNETSHGQYERLAAMLNQWPSVVELYNEIAQASGDEELQVRLLTRVAQIHEHELHSDEDAVASYEGILAISPSRVEAASAVISIHERNSNYAALVGALRSKSEILNDVEEQKDLLYRVAQIQEEVLEEADGAIATYMAVLELDDVDDTAMTALERMYISLERWEPLKDIYTTRVDHAEDPDDKKRIYHVLGQVYDQELKDTAKAIDTYQAILDIDDMELSAIQALDRLYGQAERWYDLLGNLDRQVELSEMPGDTVGLKYRVGQLWQGQLNDVSRAIETYREALEIDPGHAETLGALDGLLHGEETEPVLAAQVLEPIYQAGGEVEKLVDVLEVMGKHADDPVERVDLLHRIAELYEVSLDRSRDAFDAHVRALSEDNGNEVTLGNLERLAPQVQGWSDLGTLYSQEAEKSLDVPRQVDLLTRLARIHEEELAQPDEAIGIFNRIVEAEFDNRDAVTALDRLYSSHQRWEPLSEILRKEIQLADTEDEILTLQFRLGQVLEQALEDLPAAIEVYRDILGTDPSNSQTLAALEMVLADGQYESEIASILEPIYEGAGDFENLHRMYEVQLTKLTDPGDRQSMHQRLAELAEQQLYDQARAFSWWGRALVEDANSEIAGEEAERLAREAALWDEMVNVYTQVIERNTEDSLRKGALLRLARVYDAELGDAANAVETYLRALELEEQDAEALEALDRLYLNAGMYDELVEILRRRVEVTMDGDEIVNLHLRRGQIYGEALADFDAALKCYEQILEQESRNRFALEAQEGIFFRREDWKRLFEVYEKLVDIAEGDDEMAGLYARMARIASDALGDDESASDLLARVLDISGDEPKALATLGELYARSEKWDELIEVVERRVGVTEAVEDQVELYKMLGKIWNEKLGRERNSLDAWLLASELSPDDPETLRALASLYRATQSWEELSHTLQRIIEVAQLVGNITEEDLIELYSQLGQLEGELLGRVNEAVDAWRRVMALDAGNFRAMSALEQLFTREARWEEGIEVLERRALVVEDPAARLDTLLQAASIWEEKVLDLEKAAEVYRRVHEAEPSNVLASQRLEAIYREQYKWGELNAVLLERVEHTDDVNERIDAFGQVAKIYEEELGEQDSAFLVLQAAFREDYAHEATSKELERLATAAGKWAELLQDYTEFVTVLEVEDKTKACNLWVKIGRWYGDHLSNIDWAIHSVQACLKIDPEHLGALSALADFQRKRGSWGELVETLGKHGGIETDPQRKVEVYLSLAELLESQLQDDMQAIAAYRSALDADAEAMDALTSLDRLYRRHEMWEQLIEVLGRMAALHTDDEQVVRNRLEIGQLYDERLTDSGKAIESYKSVLDVETTNLPALRALEQLYEKTGESEAYLDVLEAQLDVSPSDAEQISLYQRMSSAWEERFGKLDRAAECYEKIVALDERNFAAYHEMARLYQQEQRWDSLVDTYRSHIMACQDQHERIQLYCSMGAVYEEQLQDYDRAIESYTDVLTFDPEEPRALDALGRLYERIEEWDRGIDVMSQLVRTTDNPEQQTDLYFRIGRITYARLGQSEEAEQQFLYALTIDESHVPTMEELVKLYADRGDWQKSAEMMVRAEGHTQNMLEKVRLLNDAAGIYLNRLGQTENAKQYFAAVLALDPEHVEAGDPLADLYFEAQEWEPLAPVLDMLVRKAPQRELDSEQLMQLYYRTARCADENNSFERALEFYKAAYDLDPTYLPVLSGRGDLLYKMEDWDGAGKIFQTILVQHRDSQDEAEVVSTYYRLGKVRQQLAERRKALNMFEKALEIDPNHRDTLLAVIGIQEAQGDYEEVIQAKRGLLATADVEEQVSLLSEIGEIYAGKLSNPQKAVSVVIEALDVVPEDRTLLQRLLDLYTETEQWKNAVETIQRFIDHEEGLRKGSYYQAAGTICRDKLKSLDEAIDYYDLALDCFFEKGTDAIPKKFLPRALKAFADIDKILTTKRDWKNQERAYRKMIKRLQPGDKILIDLWGALGEIYRSRLKAYESAIAAYEVAQQLDPTNNNRREILAELYVMSGPDHADKAVLQHMEMLKNEPFKYDSYKALRRIYMDTHQYDKTWCICNTLSFLKKADEDEMQFFEQYKPKGFVKATSRMTEEIWRKVHHPDENRYVGAIFAAIWQGAAMIRAQPHKAFGLRRKDRRAIETDQLQFSKVFYYAGQVLNVPLPDVYLQSDKQGEVAVANCHEKGNLIPSFVIYSNLLQGRPEKEIAFASAKWLTFMRPDHYLKLALPTNTELKTAFLSAIVLAKPDFPVPADMQAVVNQYLPEMRKRIQPQWLEQLAMVVTSFMANAPEIDLGRWGNAVDATSHRAGFIICGDLEVAAKMVSMEPVLVGGPQVKDKIKELVLYSISEDYFGVRAHLGTTIG